MRVLVVTKIFPNRLEPQSSPFNRQQFAALSRRCQVEVLATIPWFPGAGHLRRWSQAGRLLEVPDHEQIDGLSVAHPRFVYIPKLGHSISGPLYAASLAPTILPQRGSVDVVLGSWAYPDGFAAVVLAELLGAPAVVKVHGSDINVLAAQLGPKQRLRWALPRATRVVAVSRPLAQRVASLGVSADRIDVVPNGIDRAMFHPRPRAPARRELGLKQDSKVILYVGRVEREKGVLDLIRALGYPGFAHTELCVVGDGSAVRSAVELAARMEARVHFAGPRPFAEIPQWLAAADVLSLPSWNEGAPNVVLEALSSGRRVVATSVGGIPDVVASEEQGTLVPPRAPEALANALRRALATPYDPAGVAAGAGVISWDESADLLMQSLCLARDQLAPGVAA